MENTSLYHSGVKGMRWGVRRYQNKDGSLTPAGRKRYAKSGSSNTKGSSQNKPKAVVKGKTSTAQSKPKELTVEEKKAKVLASRSAKEVYENRKLFDYKEMEGAYNILLKDKQVRDLIVNEPNKVEKFFDDKVIPWANRVKNVTTPVVDTLKKIDEASKLFGGGEASSPQSTGKKTTTSDKSKTDKPKADKSDADKPKDDAPKTAKQKADKSNDSVEVVSGDWLGRDKSGGSGSTSSQTRSEKKSTYYDVDFVDHTPSQQTTSFVASLSGSTVAALPAPSSQARSFVAGLLPAPKED